MHPISRPPLLLPAGKSTTRQAFPIWPVENVHPQESQRLIGQAASQVQPRQVIILGAGRCEEIPLRPLAERFEHLVLIDQDRSLLQQGLTNWDLTAEHRKKIELQERDLTGLSSSLLDAVTQHLQTVTDAAEAIERMITSVDQLQPQPFGDSTGYDLVVASCVLSQLHIWACNRPLRHFAAKFPGKQLSDSLTWVQAMYRLARRMEKAFIDELGEMVLPGGRVYFSDTIQCFFVNYLDGSRWVTEGAYRMTDTLQLPDYLDKRFGVQERANWYWVIDPPQAPGQTGRVFSVQALILSRQ